MKKIERLKLKDVLSHAETEVAIAPCLTVFAGESNSGKSSVIRGLYQAMFNQPAGIDLLRHSAKRGACAETTIEGVDDTGAPFAVLRRRGNSRNEYEVNGDMLKAFGLGVPSEVQEVLNLSPNAFQLQSDGHFLLKETDGEVARILGRTVGLNDIDSAFGHIRKIKAENDTTLRIAESDVQRETEASAAYSGVDDAVRCVELAECALALYERIELSKQKMQTILSEIRALPPDAPTERANELCENLRLLCGKTASLESNCVEIRTLIREFSAVPKPVRSVTAKALLERAVALADTFAGCYEQIVNLRILKRSLQDVAEHAETKPVDELLNRLKEISKSCAENNLRRNEIKQLIKEVMACPVADEHDMQIWDGEVAKLRCCIHQIEQLRKERDALDYMLKSIKVEDNKLRVSIEECDTISSAIVIYLKDNPVCRECGAEQKHWKTV